jgi:hypothetical protein
MMKSVPFFVSRLGKLSRARYRRKESKDDFNFEKVSPARI